MKRLEEVGEKGREGFLGATGEENSVALGMALRKSLALISSLRFGHCGGEFIGVLTAAGVFTGGLCVCRPPTIFSFGSYHSCQLSNASLRKFVHISIIQFRFFFFPFRLIQYQLIYYSYISIKNRDSFYLNRKSRYHTVA